MAKKIIVPREDYILLDWLRTASRTTTKGRGMPIEWFQKVLLNSGKSEIEVGQFINQYVTNGILIKLGDVGRIKVNEGINSSVEFDYKEA